MLMPPRGREHRPYPDPDGDLAMSLDAPEPQTAVSLPLFTLEGRRLPRDSFPAAETPPDVAYQAIHDELLLDGNARLTLATFVSTWMEPAPQRLMSETYDKNMIDNDEYPQTAKTKNRCFAM